MEWLAYLDTIIWASAFVIFIIIEVTSFNLVTIWFAAGAFLNIFLTLIKINSVTAPYGASKVSAIGILWQILIFLVVSALFIIFLMPKVKRHLKNNRVKTNVEELEEKVGTVIIAVSPDQTGQIKVNGQIWTAASEGNTFEVGEKVTVTSIKGVKAIIEKIKTDKE